MFPTKNFLKICPEVLRKTEAEVELFRSSDML